MNSLNHQPRIQKYIQLMVEFQPKFSHKTFSVFWFNNKTIKFHTIPQFKIHFAPVLRSFITEKNPLTNINIKMWTTYFKPFSKLCTKYEIKPREKQKRIPMIYYVLNDDLIFLNRFLLYFHFVSTATLWWMVYRLTTGDQNEQWTEISVFFRMLNEWENIYQMRERSEFSLYTEHHWNIVHG